MIEISSDTVQFDPMPKKRSEKFVRVAGSMVSTKPEAVEIVVLNKSYSLKLPLSELIKTISIWRKKYGVKERNTGEPTAGIIISKPDLMLEQPAHERLLKLRKERQMTQVELAEKSGLTQANISSLESGRRTLGKDVAVKLGDALGVDYRLLL